ncbi:transposase [candidate division KSB1 bacterium]|nr:transposase [candidate division KSB1 bacterium]
MVYNPNKHHRRSIRLPEYDYSRAGAYFVTMCVHERQNLFGDIRDGVMRLNAAGQIVNEEWTSCGDGNPNIMLDNYVVMPDHFHGIVVFTDYIGVGAIPIGAIPIGAIHESPQQRSPRQQQQTKMTQKQRRNMGLSKLIGRFKMRSGKRINQLRGTPGLVVWQRDYYEHIIRDEAERDRIREYIETNPARWWERRKGQYGQFIKHP